MTRRSGNEHHIYIYIKDENEVSLTDMISIDLQVSLQLTSQCDRRVSILDNKIDRFINVRRHSYPLKH